jgi:hypothetical protein
LIIYKPFIKVSGLHNERIDFIKNVLENFDYAKKLKINSLDFCFLHQQGLLLKNLNIHLEKIKKENTHVKLNRIATIGDGISNFSDEETNNYAKLFDEKKRKIIRFKIHTFIWRSYQNVSIFARIYS